MNFSTGIFQGFWPEISKDIIQNTDSLNTFFTEHLLVTASSGSSRNIKELTWTLIGSKFKTLSERPSEFNCLTNNELQLPLDKWNLDKWNFR